MKPNLLLLGAAVLLVAVVLSYRYNEGFASATPAPATTPAGWAVIMFFLFLIFMITGYIFSKIGLFSPE